MKLSDYAKIMGIELKEADECPSLQELRVVENNSAGKLEELDEDTDVMDIELKLKEACSFDFEKHVSAIAESEEAATKERQKYASLNVAQENSKEFDKRYKERPQNRIRYVKR
jgi:hypothetical protein